MFFSNTLSNKLSPTPQTEVTNAIAEPLIMLVIPSFNASISFVSMCNPFKPIVKPKKVPNTPIAVKKEGAAASNLFEVIPEASVLGLKKCSASKVL